MSPRSSVGSDGRDDRLTSCTGEGVDMPEAPEMEVVAEFLREHLCGKSIARTSTLKPIVRSVPFAMNDDSVGREFESVERRGKFMIFGLSGERRIVINPKLTGGLQYCPSAQRVQKRTCVRFRLEDDVDLRYTDDRQMGQFYYVPEVDLGEVPGLEEQGPDVLDEFSLEEFRERLRRFHGEIKGVLTRGRVISGIGNAYADEILFAAEVYPFKRRKALSDDEIQRVYECSSTVILEAVDEVRERIGDRIDHKVRDFLRVHNRGGEPCPRCGRAITQLRANQRITSYCRGCQPGMLFKN